jgi:glycerol-3-phosphate acyltransferase PlsX
VQFAIMGGVFARVGLGVTRPRIGLLSIGEEANKGNELTREAHRLLKQSPVHFVGNVEGREIYSGVADVIVCDGFTGNIVLKDERGIGGNRGIAVGRRTAGHVLQPGWLPAGPPCVPPLPRRVDYSEYGGALLLGVAGLSIVCHGRSSAKAVRNAIAMAYRFATDDFIHRVEREIASAAAS